LLPVLAVFLLSASLIAEPPQQDESGCPAHQAANRGFKLIEELHHIMAPAWHEAYPEKNYAALGEACVKFESLVPKLADLNHIFKIDARKENFNKARTQFIDLVNKGRAAAEEENSTVLYGLFPDLHTRFEEMAFYLLPLHFPEYESFKVVVDLMVDTHLKNEDYEAVTSSLEALKIKNEQLQKAALPEDMKAIEKNVNSDIDAIGAKCRELEEACHSTSAKNVEDCLNKLKVLCDKFEQDYI
jgi:hypothetical protein